MPTPISATTVAAMIVFTPQCAKAIDVGQEAPSLVGFVTCLIQRGDASLRLIDGPIQFLEGRLLIREAKAAQLCQPPAMPLGPVAAILVLQPEAFPIP